MDKLRFYLDESVNVTVANGLRRRGIEALTAVESGKLGLSDQAQLTYAADNNLVIFTHDADFLALSIDSDHKGIVYAHLEKYRMGDLIRKLKNLWEISGPKEMLNHVEFL